METQLKIRKVLEANLKVEKIRKRQDPRIKKLMTRLAKARVSQGAVLNPSLNQSQNLRVAVVADQNQSQRVKREAAARTQEREADLVMIEKTGKEDMILDQEGIEVRMKIEVVEDAEEATVVRAETDEVEVEDVTEEVRETEETDGVVVTEIDGIEEVVIEMVVDLEEVVIETVADLEDTEVDQEVVDVIEEIEETEDGDQPKFIETKSI